MDQLESYIKLFISELKYPTEHINIVLSNDHHKLYYAMKFVCYLDQDLANVFNQDPSYQYQFITHISNHLSKLKSSPNIYLLCIKSDNITQVDSILNHLASGPFDLTLVIIQANMFSKYINLFIKYNIDYIIAPDLNYHHMIHTGLYYFKNLNISYNYILIADSDTIIHHQILFDIRYKFNGPCHIGGQNTIKYWDQSNLASYDISTTSSRIMPNWFIINHKFIEKINWQLLNGQLNIYDQFNTLVDRFKMNVFMYTPPNNMNGVVCTQYLNHSSITIKSNNNMTPLELTLKAILIDCNKKPKLNTLNQTESKEIEPIEPIEPVEPIEPIEPIDPNDEIEIDCNNMITINKYYFITNDPKHAFENKLSRINMTGIGININYLNIYYSGIIKKNSYITALNDAIKNKFNNILLIDDNFAPATLSIWQYLKNELNSNNIYDILIICTSSYDSITRIDQYTPLGHIKPNAICLNINVCSPLVLSLSRNLSLMASIEKLASSYNIYLIHKSNITGKSTQLTQSTQSTTNTQLDPIQSICMNQTLSTPELLCIESFIANGYKFHLYSYGPIDNMPTNPNMITMAANEIMQLKPNSLNNYDKFINMFKYRLLYAKGGYWINLDIVCMKRFNPNLNSDPYLFIVGDTGDLILKCPPHSDFAKCCFNTYANNYVKPGLAGKLLINSINKYNLKRYMKPLDQYAPVSMSNCRLLTSPINKLSKKLLDDSNIYTICIWTSFWPSFGLDVTKQYHGTVYGKLLDRYLKHDMNLDTLDNTYFNLEQAYGKYNKTCVIFYWMPVDPNLELNTFNLIAQCESSGNYLDVYDQKKNYARKEPIMTTSDRIKEFVESDIYVQMYKYLLDTGVFEHIEIIFGIGLNDKYMYNHDSLFDNGNYCEYSDKIHLWKLNDLNSLFSFAFANTYFYKGYGNHEHMVSLMTTISPNSIFIRYLATALPLKSKTNSNSIIVDDSYVETFANNNKLKNQLSGRSQYYSKIYTNYDIVYVDSVDKIPNHKIIFPNAAMFPKLNKFSLMKYNPNTKRIYDMMFCASDTHPSKGWNILFEFIDHCEMSKKYIRLLIVTPVLNVNNKLFDNYISKQYIKLTIKRGLTRAELSEYYNMSNSLFIASGRDANPRVMSESLGCGCFNIVLDILTDGKDILDGKPELGIIINTSTKYYVDKYQSVSCHLVSGQFDHIYQLATIKYDNQLISNVFNQNYNLAKSSDELANNIHGIRMDKQRYVCTMATESYANNLNLLLGSIKYTNPCLNVIVYAINWSNDLIAKFQNQYPKYYFKAIEMTNCERSNILKQKVRVIYDCYQNRVPFIWIDADSVVLRPLDVLFDKLVDYSMLAVYRPDQEYYMKFAAGVIGFSIGGINDEFVEMLVNRVENTVGHNGWFNDQIGLYETYVNFIDRVRLYELGEHEHSIMDTVDTVVFSRRNDNVHSLRDLMTMYGIDVLEIDFGGIEFRYQ